MLSLILAQAYVAYCVLFLPLVPVEVAHTGQQEQILMVINGLLQVGEHNEH